ncbi:hypothetical protein ACUHMQ_18990 [Chitinimonas sp. PSY-7]|uniref:hypothetical protein n=1 Tax=Chitinimonas sp. PSY-7 TaxID=3459088 RepID=UPI00404036B3
MLDGKELLKNLMQKQKSVKSEKFSDGQIFCDQQNLILIKGNLKSTTSQASQEIDSGEVNSFDRSKSGLNKLELDGLEDLVRGNRTGKPR